VLAEFRALASGCGVYELVSRTKISLSGNDRVRWLNGMISNNIRDLAPGHGVYAFLLNPQGHILGDLYAYNRGETILLDIAQDQKEKISATLRRYIIMDKVELADASGEVAAVGICGPKALEVLRTAGFEVRDLASLQLVNLAWRDIPAAVLRGDNAGVTSFEIWLVPEHAANLQQELVKAGAQAVGADALELLRIASGIPRYGQDIRERDLPQETEQLRALSFTKGCYIGQEIVERIRSRGAVHRKFTGFVAEGILPGADAKVQSDGKDVGEITSVASLPLVGDQFVALGYIRREAAQPGKLLEAGGVKLTVADIPFTDAFKN
jgi:aminomethyltransferase